MYEITCNIKCLSAGFYPESFSNITHCPLECTVCDYFIFHNLGTLFRSEGVNAPMEGGTGIPLGSPGVR